MQFINKLPYPMLIILTVFMLGAPFVPEPHLVEKMRMLMAGTLTKPLDIGHFLQVADALLDVATTLPPGQA